MHISQIAIPQYSLITKSLPANHYADCFSCQFKSNQSIQLDSVARFLLNYNPVWVKWLIVFRNMLVKPFGLQTGTEKSPILTISKGGNVAFFKVLDATDEEVLLYAADKHLSACLSVIMNRLHNQYEISVSTTVYFHNNLGKVYFFFVKPFHILIVKSMLIRMIKNFS